MAAGRCRGGPSPLETARQDLGLSLGEIASKLSVSESAVSRWMTGSRPPPAALFLVLGASDLSARHENWMVAHGFKRLGKVTMELEAVLPAGVTIPEAKAACIEAIAEMRGGGAAT